MINIVKVFLKVFTHRQGISPFLSISEIQLAFNYSELYSYRVAENACSEMKGKLRDELRKLERYYYLMSSYGWKIQTQGGGIQYFSFDVGSWRRK